MNELNDITAIILAGGFGTRLKSVISEKQKVMAHVKDKPFITYLLEQLNLYGVKHVVICIGYKGEQVISEFGNNYKNLNINYSEEKTPMGTGGALRFAEPFIRSKEAIVMNGDSFCDVNLIDFYLWHIKKNSKSSITIVEKEDTSRYGKVNIDENNIIVNFQEKALSTGTGWINAGIYLFSKDLIHSIPYNKKVSLETDMFPMWIKNGLYGYKSNGNFIDIGTPESYLASENFFTKF